MQARADLPRSPTEALAQIENLAFEIGAGAAWGVLWTSGSIGQGTIRCQAESAEPFVTGLATDAELATGLSDGRLQRIDLVDEGKADLRHRQHLPWHDAPPWNRCSLPLKCYLCLFHACYPCPCHNQASVALGYETRNDDSPVGAKHVLRVESRMTGRGYFAPLGLWFALANLTQASAALRPGL